MIPALFLVVAFHKELLSAATPHKTMDVRGAHRHSFGPIRAAVPVWRERHFYTVDGLMP